MTLVLATIAIIVCIFGPQVWCSHIMKRYSEEIDLIPGTGGEFAQHLVKQLHMEEVSVETTDSGQDHYDPSSRTVRLGENNFTGKSLTAVAVAAHEVGHALQHHLNYKPLLIRTRITTVSNIAAKVASGILVCFPFLLILTKSHWLGIIMFLAGVSLMLLPVIMHLITLPVEWDASFGRALPIMETGSYLPESATPIIKQILTAAALTYVAGSLASLLNFYRWIAILRR